MEQTNNFQKFKLPLITGGIFLAIVILIEILIYFNCTNDLGCLALAFIFAFPAAILGLQLGTLSSFMINILFYFLVGALVGYLIQRFRK